MVAIGDKVTYKGVPNVIIDIGSKYVVMIPESKYSDRFTKTKVDFSPFLVRSEFTNIVELSKFKELYHD